MAMEPAEKRSLAPKNEEAKALHLAETTDLSPQQAKELLHKHGGDMKKAKREAENFKAEG
ncbi:hypothetical protein ACSBOB_11565 [Mesorhizobium sp. ASY16-5R]|uniref:hypothetical protein n=1 Tax=Mesorhizobium sp. ASY16-5R TaxID=3445772 RepID=UPI003F9F8451